MEKEVADDRDTWYGLKDWNQRNNNNNTLLILLHSWRTSFVMIIV